jgi:hypothetical protein
MGSVELLSREGEIAIAKRIEAGRETMIAGLCESPLTFQAIIIWREELNEGRQVLLRDIIDLETTYAGPEAKAAPQFQTPGKDRGRPQGGRGKGRPAPRRPPPTTSPMSAAKARISKRTTTTTTRTISRSPPWRRSFARR